MSLRSLLPLGLIAVLIAIGMILFTDSGTNGVSGEHQESGASLENREAVNLAGQTAGSESTDVAKLRIELPPEEAKLLATSQAIGIPSFTGRVLLPSGHPAKNCELLGFGLDGWAMWMDAETEQAPDTVRLSATTDETGYFQLPECPQDGLRFLIRIKHLDHPPFQLVNLPAVPGRTRDLGEIRLQNGFELSGYVVGPNGEAIPNAKVFPVIEPDTATFSVRRRRALPRLTDYEATTNSQGHFKFTHLPPGKLHLQAEAEHYAIGYSAGIRGQETESVNGLQIQLDAATSLIGVVIGPASEPIADARLRLDINRDERLYARSDENGRFQFETPVGLEKPKLRAYAVGFNPKQIKVDEPTTEQFIQLDALPPLVGVILDQGGAAIANAEVRLIELSGRRNRQSNPQRLDDSGNTQSSKDGGFSLDPDLRRTWGRKFRLVAWTDKHIPAWTNSFEFKEEENQQLPPFTITLTQGGLISGTVAKPDGSNAVGARVHLRHMLSNRRATSRGPIAPDSRRPGSIQATATVDADGSFQFSAIPDGDYRLEALLSGYSPGYGNEFALLADPFEEHLELQLSSRLWGSVIGDISALGTLRITASSEHHDDLHTTVDANGNFEFIDLPSDTWSLILREVDASLSAGSFGMGTGEGLARADGIELPPGGDKQVDLEIDFAGRAALYGNVTLNGKFASNINLFLMPRDLGTTGDPRLSWRRVSRSLKTAATDFKGEYRFVGIDPEDYWLVLDTGGSWPEGLMNFGDPGEVQTGPTGLQRHNISLRANQELRMDLNLQLGHISGVAIQADKNGKPVRNSKGTATPISVGEGIASRTFDISRNGQFKISDLPAGEWQLKVNSSTLKSKAETVMVYANSKSEIEIECKRKESKK